MQTAGGEALTETGPGARLRTRWWLAALALVVIGFDLLTKQLAVAHLAGEEPVRLFGGAVYLTYATNSGAAFNIGSSVTWLFSVIAILVIGWITVMARKLRSRPWAVALGLVAGGAAGNLTDRLFREPGVFRGEVVDMVSLFVPDGSIWPIFNVADAALVVGVALAVWLELTGRRRDGSRMRDEPRARTGDAT